MNSSIRVAIKLMLLEFIQFQLSILRPLWPYIQLTWWAWLPPLLAFGAWKMWVFYLRVWYFANLKWVLLEVRIPKEMAKSPQAMEQIFAGLHSAFRRFDFEEKYWKGLQTDYFSFEIVSVGGKVHFYIYTPSDYINLIQALVYSQYPESEVKEVEDYSPTLPENIPNDEWNLFGTEFALAKPDPYPIRTYKDFLVEDISLKEEARKVDPLSALAEVLSNIKTHEVVGVHFLIRPTGDDWKKKAEELVFKLIGREIPKKSGLLEQLLPGGNMDLSWPIREVVWPGSDVLTGKNEKKSEKSPDMLMMRLSPGEQEIVKAVEKNIAKIGYETILRFIYIGKAKEFDMMNFAAIQGVLRQFNTLNLNSFKTQSKGMTTAKWYNPWRVRVKLRKKKKFYNYFKLRKPFLDTYILHSKPFIFNIEELATVYHFPGGTVGALTTQRIEAKRGEPPSDLPI